MRGMLKLWIVVLIGALIGVAVSIDSGYVLLSVGLYTVEMSLALLALLAAGAFVALYFGIRSVICATHIPRDLKQWNHKRTAQRAQQAMTRGLLEMSEGDWVRAEKRLVKYAERSETPLLNYLAAARAAQLQGEHERRDTYIRLAHEHMPSANVAVSLTQAELQLADHQLEQALATLKHLRSIAPKHTYVLRLLRRLYEQLGDWENLRDLIPELRKRKVETAEELATLELKTHRALLEQAFLLTEPTRLYVAWDNVPKALRLNPQIASDYAGYLQERGKDDDADQLIRDALKKGWNTSLIEVYGHLEVKEPGKKLSLMEKHLDQHPDDPALLLTLGRLSLRSQLWGKARAYFEACIGANGPVEAYRELGRLLEHMHEDGIALEIYRKALAHDAENSHAIPIPQDIGPKHNMPAEPEPEENPIPYIGVTKKAEAQ